MKKYVVGFAFNPDHVYVGLVVKDHPDWQRGKYNGIGGKIKGDESSKAAMVREFEEEAGVITTEDMWLHYFRLTGHEEGNPNGEAYCVDFFTTTDVVLDHLRTMETEPIRVVYRDSVTRHNAIPNLLWLMPMAIHFLNADDRADWIVGVEQYGELV